MEIRIQQYLCKFCTKLSNNLFFVAEKGAIILSPRFQAVIKLKNRTKSL